MFDVHLHADFVDGHYEVVLSPVSSPDIGFKRGWRSRFIHRKRVSMFQRNPSGISGLDQSGFEECAIDARNDPFS